MRTADTNKAILSACVGYDSLVVYVLVWMPHDIKSTVSSSKSSLSAICVVSSVVHKVQTTRDANEHHGGRSALTMCYHFAPVAMRDGITQWHKPQHM